MPERWGKVLEEAARQSTSEKRHWWLWVEDCLIALGALVLLVVAILSWRGARLDAVLHADLAAMAVILVLRVGRFVRVHYFGRGRGAPKG